MTFLFTEFFFIFLYFFLKTDGRFPTPEQCPNASPLCQCFDKQNGLPHIILLCQNLENSHDLQKLTSDLWDPLVRINFPAKSVHLFIELQITNSKLPYISHQVLQNICFFKALNLSRSAVHVIEPKTFSCNITEGLEELDLSNNNLTEIYDWFSRPSHLQKLHLDNNNIHTINSNAFMFLGHLQMLNLSFNDLTVIYNYHFHNMTSLKILALAHNNISQIESQALNHLVNLNVLDLSFNNIQYFNPEASLQLNKLSQLSLAHNQLVLLDGQNFTTLQHLSELHLEGNPWACNDSMLWLYEVFNPSPVELSLNGSIVLCFSPEYLQNKTVLQWFEVKSMEESFHQTETCQICECYVKKNALVSVVDCRGRGLTHLPELLPINTKVVRMENNKIKSLASVSINGFVGGWQNVLHLHLENNVIESLKGIEGTRLVQKLALFQLTKNRLREIPVHILDQFTESLSGLFLGDNPWDCDCNTIRFQNWLRTHPKMVSDMENIHCGPDAINNFGKAIYKLMKSDLCPQAREGVNYLDVLNVVMAVLIVTILSKLILDYWWQKRTGKLPHFFSFKLH